MYARTHARTHNKTPTNVFFINGLTQLEALMCILGSMRSLPDKSAIDDQKHRKP